MTMIAERTDKLSAPRRILPRAVYTARAADRRDWVIPGATAAQPTTSQLLNI